MAKGSGGGGGGSGGRSGGSTGDKWSEFKSVRRNGRKASLSPASEYGGWHVMVGPPDASWAQLHTSADTRREAIQLANRYLDTGR